VRGSVVTYHHQAGTCRMGTDADAVVDPSSFAVHGLSGLRLADASIMPQVTTGNTNAPTIMIAERAAAALVASPVEGITAPCHLPGNRSSGGLFLGERGRSQVEAFDLIGAELETGCGHDGLKLIRR